MKRKSRVALRVSRFIILALSIIIQAIILWVIFFKLNEQHTLLYLISSIIGALMFLFIVNKDQASVYKIPWIILFCTFPVLAVVIYFTFGNLKLSRGYVKKLNSVFENNYNDENKTQAILNEVKEFDGQKYGQMKYLTSVCSLSVYNDSFIDFLPSGERYFESVKQQLSLAKKYIFIECFIIEEGVMWNEIYDILRQKVGECVEVYVMYDDVGSMPRLDKNYYLELEKEGIKCVKFNPFRPIVSIIHNNRDHRKIIVVDGAVGFVGGINIADEYINVKKPFGRWKDCAVILKGGAVDSLVKMFCQLYNVASKNKLEVEKFLEKSHQIYNNYGYVLPYMDGPAPVFKEHIAENAYLNVINKAVDYLYITSPYLVVDNNIIDALKNASQRGVDVKLILPEIPDKKVISVMTRSNYERLIKHGVKIYEYKGGFIHSKTFVSDDVGIVGSINLDYRSLVHHFECAVLTCNNDCVIKIKKDFENTCNNECKIVTKEMAKQNAFSKLLKNILNIFSPLF